MMARPRSFVPGRFCLAIFGASFLGLFPLIFKDLRYSVYYRNPFHNSSLEMAYHLRQNELRTSAALQFWNSLIEHNVSVDFTKTATNQQKVDIAVMIITTSRHVSMQGDYNPWFLTQVLWQFLIILNSTETRALPWKITLSVCNTDTKYNEEANKFSSHVQHFQRWSKEPEGITQMNIKEKEKQDYAFCLEQSLKSNPQYSLLVEDDAFPHPQLFHILYYLLEIRKGKRASRRSRSNIVFYKLYHPERLLGFWSLEPERLLQLLSFSVLCGSCVTFIADFVMHLCGRRQSSSGIWPWAVVYFLLMAIAVSRQHLIELRYLSRNLFTVGPAPSCCTPGMLFVADRAWDWLQYMQTHSCEQDYAKDFMLDYYIHKYNLEGLIVQPNLFVHIGFFSSLSQTLLNPSLLYYPEWFKVF